MKAPLIDRRKSVRIKGDFDLNLGESSTIQSCRAIDISLAGMCCEVTGKLPLFEEVEIRFKLPEPLDQVVQKKEYLICKGVVVRKERTSQSGKYKVAFYFTEWEEESRAIMAAYIKSHTAPSAA